MRILVVGLWLTRVCLSAPTDSPAAPDALSLGPNETALLEAIVDEAIAKEEVERKRREGIPSIKSALFKKRFSSGTPHDSYGPPHDYHTKSFDLVAFKKAILGALLQSIKAITGGVIALSGQLVKVKGHLVEAKGKFMEVKGDAITKFGKHLATKALLNPVHVSNYDHNVPAPSYGPPSSHGPYPAAAPASSYGAPSSSGFSSSHGSSFSSPSISHGGYEGPVPPSFIAPSANFHSAPSNSWGGVQLGGGHFAEPPNSYLKRDVKLQKKEGKAIGGSQPGVLVLRPLTISEDSKENDQHPLYKNPEPFSNRRISSSGPRRRDTSEEDSVVQEK